MVRGLHFIACSQLQCGALSDTLDGGAGIRSSEDALALSYAPFTLQNYPERHQDRGVSVGEMQRNVEIFH